MNTLALHSFVNTFEKVSSMDKQSSIPIGLGVGVGVGALAAEEGNRGKGALIGGLYGGAAGAGVNLVRNLWAMGRSLREGGPVYHTATQAKGGRKARADLKARQRVWEAEETLADEAFT
jgi:hypothetical protein